MKKFLTILLLCIAVNAKADSWVQKAGFPGLGLLAPFTFTIGNKGYVGCGQDTTTNLNNDFWEYDPSTNSWTQKASFGGSPRFAATGFSIGNKGYAGLGGYSILKQDFWEYNPVSNSWTQKANFGGGIRGGAVGFSINTFGYMGIGLVNSSGLIINDLWQYDPLLDLWSQKMSLPGTLIRGANYFVIGTNAYVVAGIDSALPRTDLWEYNSILNAWTQKANLPSTPRFVGAAFTICDKGYFGVGQAVVGGLPMRLNDLWQYDPLTNAWNQKLNFPGSNRDAPAFFSIGNKGYIGLGRTATSFSSDFYEYTPDSACSTGITEYKVSNFTIYPNPSRKEFTVYGLPLNKNIAIKMFDTKGKTVLSKLEQTVTGNLTMPIANFQSGIYFVQIVEGENRTVRKVVVE